MKIIYSDRFVKSFDKSNLKLKAKINERISLFRNNPLHPLLRNHALHGEMVGKRAISVTGDVRIIFQEFESYTVVLFLDVGKHGKVY